MNMLKKGKELVYSEGVQEFSINLLSDCFALLRGDVTALARILYSVTKGTLDVKDQLFWEKFENFLNDLDATDDFLGEFCRVLTEDWGQPENQKRLLETIDKIDTNSKAKYLATASRCLAARMISRSEYFRICHLLKTNLQEDLLFLQKEILENREYEYDDTIQGLWSSGLMYQSVVSPNGDDRYMFTPFAKTLDKYALSYDNLERYPMILEGKAATEPHRLSVTVGIPIEEF